MFLWSNDGSSYDKTKIKQAGFLLDPLKDIRIIHGEKGDIKDQVYNFVGFVANKQGNILSVLPKHYQVTDIELDCKKVFTCIFKYLNNKQRDCTNDSEQYLSNYPFDTFFEIYNYYLSYGLYIEDKVFNKPDIGGKINWKYTITKSNKYLINNNVIISPIYYQKKNYFFNFITYCMIFIIDYTIEQFGFIIDAEVTGEEMPEFDFLEQSELVLQTLNLIKQQTFKDNEINLIDNLIAFFIDFNSKGKGENYYFKCYNFSSIWEDIVKSYLNNYYKGINSKNEMEFYSVKSKCLNFQKQKFHINAAKPDWFIEPDYYCEDGDKQLIFDAKYYNEVKKMDYKQISYFFLLKDMEDSLSSKPKFSKTFSSLILPSNKRQTKIHFQFNKNYNSCYKEFIITEEYLNITELITYYINNF